MLIIKDYSDYAVSNGKQAHNNTNQAIIPFFLLYLNNGNLKAPTLVLLAVNN